MPAERGILKWQDIEPAIGAKIYYRAQTGLISLENTHNMAGGTVTPLPVLEEIWDGAKKAGLPVHLDGARIFNASIALGVPVKELTRGVFDGDVLPIERTVRAGGIDDCGRPGADR